MTATRKQALHAQPQAIYIPCVYMLLLSVVMAMYSNSTTCISVHCKKVGFPVSQVVSYYTPLHSMTVRDTPRGVQQNTHLFFLQWSCLYQASHYQAERKQVFEVLIAS